MEDPRRQLHFYHSHWGVRMNVSELTWAAMRASPVPSLHEPTFQIFFSAKRQCEWYPDLVTKQASLSHRLEHIYSMHCVTKRAVRRVGFNATSFDDLPISLIRTMRFIGNYSYHSYQRRLNTHPSVLNNVVVYLGIPKGGPPHLFGSHRPTNIGSTRNPCICATHRRV